MAEASKSGVFTFDGFRLDVGNLMLSRGGEEFVLAPKVVKTLAVLVEEAGNIVTKEELINRVWDDSIVEESNLSQNLYLLRKTLGKKADGSPYIETLRRRGYRFTSEDVAVEASPIETKALPVAEVASSPRYPVERRGNVVALLDWKEADEPDAAESVDQRTDPAVAENYSTRRLFIAAAVLVAFAGLGVFIWFNSTRAAQVADETPLEVEAIPLTNGEYVADATISRDGKYFTYHEIDGEYSRVLVQQVGQAKPIEVVPRVRRFVGPKTFSPDGQSLYYMARDPDADHWSVFRVPTLGGVSTKIVEESTSHVSFSPDGNSIAYIRSKPVFSVAVAAADGTGERNVLEAEPSTSFSPNPAWSPDGKTIVFGHVFANGPSPGRCVITGVDPETAAVRTISPEDWSTCYRIEWRHDGEGMVLIGTKYGEAATIRRDQVFHLAAKDGAARRLTSDPSRKGSGSLGITDTNDVLAVPLTRSSQIWVMDPKGAGKTAKRLTNGSADGRAGLVPLRDGRIAFITRTGENLGIWTIDSDGGDRRQVLSDPPLAEELRATPDGNHFFFAHETQGRIHLFRVDADGGNLKQITTGDSYETDSTVSPDGKWIAFDSTLYQGEPPRIWRSSIEGGAPTKISDQICHVPSYSPSGKFISCVWDQQVLVISAEDGRLVNTFRGAPIPILNIGARWTPDEKNLVYTVNERGTTNLWIQPLDGKPARRLTDFVDGDIYNFAYSPDGSKLYLARGYPVRDAILIKNIH
ncbi:MAG TPA: winged helix-turn-helix domain-containing protein [Pyrinomonadaceae bacterium]|nr:winged helix-turn-helix domain-containing protein [Pyrinomonadaceae bacterium]